MYKGGYKLIDLKRTNLVPGSASTVKGVHAAIENNHCKMTVLTGIVISEKEIADVPVQFVTSGADLVGHLILSAGTKTITITAKDAVTVEA